MRLENEKLKDALEKEQENSYKILQDVHQQHNEASLYKD